MLLRYEMEHFRLHRANKTSGQLLNQIQTNLNVGVADVEVEISNQELGGGIDRAGRSQAPSTTSAAPFETIVLP